MNVKLQQRGAGVVFISGKPSVVILLVSNHTGPTPTKGISHK